MRKQHIKRHKYNRKEFKTVSNKLRSIDHKDYKNQKDLVIWEGLKQKTIFKKGCIMMTIESIPVREKVNKRTIEMGQIMEF